MKIPRAAFLFCFFVVAGLPAPALASGTESAAAQALFDEGRRLMKEEKYEEACPKLKESLRLEPAIGTQFNLANCYEKLGRTATAWSLYLEVAAQARAADRRPRERLARERAAALEAQLARLSVVVPQAARVEGLSIIRDGVEVGAAQWGVPVPVDPGTHSVSASAPGYESWTGQVEVEGAGTAQAVQVPVLHKLPTGGAPALPPPALPGSSLATPEVEAPSGSGGLSTTQYVGAGVAAVGVVSLGLGTFLLTEALSKHDDSGCGETCPDGGAKALNDEARARGNAATGAFVVGLVGLAAGATLFFVDFDGGDGDRVQVGTGVGPGAAVVRVEGTF